MHTKTPSFPWARINNAADLAALRKEIEQLPYNAWSGASLLDKHGRPITLISHRANPTAYSTNLLGIVFGGPDKHRLREETLVMLDDIYRRRTGQPGMVWNRA